jgi:glycerophosphoryl diester phosphodiesterase
MLNVRRATTGKPSLVGHRGAADCAPENTMVAFRTGLAQGADIIELDVQLTADGHVVAFHDPTLERTTNGRGALVQHTLAQLRDLDAGRWFSPRFAGETIPTLEEVLTWAHDRVPLFVELKYPPAPVAAPSSLAGSDSLEAAVVRLVNAHAMRDQVMLISFDHQALYRAKEQAPDLATGVLYAQPVDDPISLARAVQANVVMPLWSLVTSGCVDRCHAAGLAVSVWGADPDYAALLAAGVDCMNADDPARVRQAFSQL